MKSASTFDSIFGPKPGLSRPGMDQDAESVNVIGNLPYFLTSDILLRLFEYRKYFRTMVLMVQREVADRLAAQPGKSEYGLLSATAQLYARVDKLFAGRSAQMSHLGRLYSERRELAEMAIRGQSA